MSSSVWRVFGMAGWGSEERKGYYIQRKFNWWGKREKKIR